MTPPTAWVVASFLSRQMTPPEDDIAARQTPAFTHRVAFMLHWPAN
jgi:hypothetical protein